MCCALLAGFSGQNGAYLFGVVDPTQSLFYDHGWRRGSRDSRACAGLPEVFVHLTRPRASPWEFCGGTGGQEEGAAGNKRSEAGRAAVPMPCGFEAQNGGWGLPTSEVLSGVVALVKSPCMHPGDLQLCYAVGP